MEEHAAALRLMALTLCKPINTCFGLPTTQFYTAEAEDLESELQAKADAALSKLRKQVSAVESLHLIKMDQLARLNAKRNARMLAKGVYDDYNDLADAVQMHRAALKAAATDAARVTAIAAFMKDFDEDGQLFYSFFMPGTPRRLTDKPPPQDSVVDVPALVERFSKGAHVTIASGTNTGKSFLARAIAKELVDIGSVHDVLVLSDDPETAEATYYPVLGDDLENAALFCEQNLSAIFERQKSARKKNKLRSMLLIVDDVSGVEKSATLEMLFKRGRHMGIQVMLLNQMANKSMATWAKANSSLILFSMLPPTGMKDLHVSMTLVPPMQPKAFSDWAAANVGGAQGTPTRYVFGVYERDYQAIYKVKK